MSLGIHPAAFNRRQKQLLKGAAALERHKHPTVPLTRRSAKLEEKLSTNKEVIAELPEEQIKASRTAGPQELGDA